MKLKKFKYIFWASLREDTHIKKWFFLVVGPLSFYLPYTNGLVVHATIFLCVASLTDLMLSLCFGCNRLRALRGIDPIFRARSIYR